jgi:hypothetical protein
VFYSLPNPGCHFGCLSEKSRPKDVVQKRIRYGQPPADNQSARLSALVDGLAVEVSDGRLVDRADSHPYGMDTTDMRFYNQEHFSKFIELNH